MSGPYHSGNSRKMQILHAEYVIYIHTSMPVITDKIVEQLVFQGNKNAWVFFVRKQWQLSPTQTRAKLQSVDQEQHMPYNFSILQTSEASLLQQFPQINLKITVIFLGGRGGG